MYLCSNQVAHHKSAPYHPATNGLVENMVMNVKQWLKKQEKGVTFSTVLSDFLRTYCNVPHTEAGRSPAELVFDSAPYTHLSMVLPNTSERLKSRLQPPETIKESQSFKQGNTAWVRDCRPVLVLTGKGGHSRSSSTTQLCCRNLWKFPTEGSY